MASSKKPKFDTSFAFGANATRSKSKKAGRRQSTATRQAYALAYRTGQHPRQTSGAGGGS
jgi:hypothetical protein